MQNLVNEPLQYGRKYLLVIGVQKDIKAGVLKPSVIEAQRNKSVVIDELNISFDINKSRDNKRSSNKASVKVYNLSKDTRAFVQTSKDTFVNVSLYAGYRDTNGMDLLVQGNITYSTTEKDGGDFITTFHIEENFVALNNTQVLSTLPPGQTIEAVIEKVRADMSEQSVSAGGPPIVKGSYTGTNKNSTLLHGFSMSGSARQILDDLCLAYGIEWQLDNGKLSIKDEGSRLAEKATRTYKLSKETGLIDLPAFEEHTMKVRLKKPIKTTEVVNGQKKTKTKTVHQFKYIGITFKALLNPFLRPGDLVQVITEQESFKNGAYFQIRDIRYYGEYLGQDWYIEAFCDEVELIA